MASGHSESRKTNRLAQEQSAYLLQHAENPVDWFPWSEEAFAVARQRECPIFLSIGYSSCHWCHVMEHESFNSEEISEVLNKNFVSIKVDKEQRPDVDKTYMAYIQATQGGGGWPMSVFLTPDLHPFFGGTYFPPQDAYGRPGFKTVLDRLVSIWKQKKEEIKTSSADSMRQLGEIISSSARGNGEAGGTIEELVKSISHCATSFEQRFDSRLGGFGSAPKFPRPSELLALMTEYARLISINKEDEARKLITCASAILPLRKWRRRTVFFCSGKLNRCLQFNVSTSFSILDRSYASHGDIHYETNGCWWYERPVGWWFSSLLC
jgi:uncharacterized protein YyaL (SSP411 family)